MNFTVWPCANSTQYCDTADAYMVKGTLKYDEATKIDYTQDKLTAFCTDSYSKLKDLLPG